MKTLWMVLPAAAAALKGWPAHFDITRYEILTPAVIFGGRLGEYKYYDMDEVIAQTLKICRKEWDSQD